MITPRRAFLALLGSVVMPPVARGFSRAEGGATRVQPRSVRRAPLTAIGFATYYSRAFHGLRTASGIRYNQNALTAAHRRWPFGTLVRVTDVRSGRSVIVRITDRGPFGRRRRGVLVDLSRAAAKRLGMLRRGRARVRLQVLRWGFRLRGRRASRTVMRASR